MADNNILHIITPSDNKEKEKSRVTDFTSDIESDGSIYNKQRDPPDQKSIYILPGDPEKETYRLSTFTKFPQTIPVNVCLLAAHGFLYTGYKDRVECFSCKSNIQDWAVGDDPKSARWHLNGCKLVLGTETLNQPIGGHPVHFEKTMNHDSGQSNNNSPIKLDSSVNGLQIASIVPNGHRKLIYNQLALNKEEDRRKSFATWSCNYINVTVNALAKSGFFYLGDLDRVQCFSCSGVLRNWTSNDNVDQEHERHFPRCKMVLGTESRSIALPCSPTEPEPRPQIVKPCDPHPQEVQILQKPFPCLHPENPHMMSEQSRLETFDYRWPSRHVIATKEQIAKAGFYFLGERDRTKCWYCNGGLQNWDPNDEPWTEHAKWFPGCEFLLNQKGNVYVKKVLERFPNKTTSSLLVQTQDSCGSSLLSCKKTASMKDSDVKKMEMEEKIKHAVYKQNKLHGKSFDNIEEIIKAAKREIDEEQTCQIDDAVDGIIAEAENHQTTLAANGESYERNNQNILKARIDVTTKDILCGIMKSANCKIVKPSCQVLNANNQEEKDVSFSKKVSDLPIATKEILDSENEVYNLQLLELENWKKCKACYYRDADRLILPCAHLVCENCMKQVNKCPICNISMEKKIEVKRP